MQYIWAIYVILIHQILLLKEAILGRGGRDYRNMFKFTAIALKYTFMPFIDYYNYYYYFFVNTVVLKSVITAWTSFNHT